MIAPSTIRRNDELDSLRGIAALIVVVHHCLIAQPAFYPYGQESASWIVRALTFSPLHFFWAGYEAVIFFFVLSGFVLTLPYTDGRKMNPGAFIVNRIFRIYPPYLAAMAAAIFLCLHFSREETRVLSPMFNDAWKGFDWQQVWQYLLLIGPIDIRMNSVIWSLKLEMQVSLLFPLILPAAFALKPKAAVPAVILAMACGFYLADQTWPVVDHPRFFAISAVFLAGTLTARFRRPLCGVYLRMAPAMKAVILVSAAAASCIRWYHYPRGGWKELPVFVFDHIVITAAACVFIVAALSLEGKNSFLSKRPLVFLGRISYSLYLYHVPVLLAMVHAFYGRFPLLVLICSGVVLSILAAAVSYFLIEVPSMRLGRRIAAWMGSRNSVRAAAGS